MFWVTGACGCTLHWTGRSSKTISPCTDITCTDTGALGPHLATSGFYHLSDKQMMKIITLVTCTRSKAFFSFLSSPSEYFLRSLFTIVRRDWIKARPLLRGYVRWSLVGRLWRDVMTCHEADKSVTRVWQECDAVMYLHFCHPCGRSCVM